MFITGCAVLDSAVNLKRTSGIQVWPVSVLLKAVSETLETRFNPVAVQGEISGFSRAGSGHCYFSLKDDTGQVRCAMFRRAAVLLDFTPRDGQLVEVRGRIGLYEPRGELQLVAESMQQAGQGTLFDQYLKLKAKLEIEGLFQTSRKKSLPNMPKAIGVVTSLGAAALHDVATALARRVPHIPVYIYPASVQGAQAAEQLRQALLTSYQRQEVDVLLLVRGGGAIDDLWVFNDEQLARTIVQSPIPVVTGIGHETDFTIADFCADLRAPTPTAAAELCAQPQELWLAVLEGMRDRLQDSVSMQLQTVGQRLDLATARLSQPSHYVTRQQARLAICKQSLYHSQLAGLGHAQSRLLRAAQQFPKAIQQAYWQHQQRLVNSSLRLEPLNPRLVLTRGYAWLADPDGSAVTSIGQTHVGQPLRATLMDGEVDLTVTRPRLI